MTGPFGFEKKLNSSSTKITLLNSYHCDANINLAWLLIHLPADVQPMASFFPSVQEFHVKA